MLKNDRKLTGDFGEQAACNFLLKQGMKLAERNWRYKSLELDIIAKDKDELVFIEVKTRIKDGLTRPEQNVNSSKQQKLIRAASHYLNYSQNWETPCRFDIISVVVENNNELSLYSLEHIKNAFSLMDSGYTSW